MVVRARDAANLSQEQWLHPIVGLGLQAFSLEFPYPGGNDRIVQNVKVSVEAPESWKRWLAL